MVIWHEVKNEMTILSAAKAHFWNNQHMLYKSQRARPGLPLVFPKKLGTL